MKVNKIILLLVMICLLLSSCAKNTISEDIVHTELFDYKEIYRGTHYRIVVDGTTGVLYVHIYGDYLSGLSPLYNVDGSLKVYRGELE